jgi:hypothetical protein
MQRSTDLRCVFAIRSAGFNAAGYLYSVEASRVDAAEVLAHFERHAASCIRAGIVAPGLAAGYAFIHDGRVWNCWTHLRTVAYDERGIYADIDDIGYSLAFLQDAVLLFDYQRRRRSSICETIEIAIKRFDGPRSFVLTGLNLSGRVIYPSIVVDAARFWRELRAATEAWLDFTRRFQTALDAISRRSGFEYRWLSPASIDAWRSALDTLKARAR